MCSTFIRSTARHRSSLPRNSTSQQCYKYFAGYCMASIHATRNITLSEQHQIYQTSGTASSAISIVVRPGLYCISLEQESQGPTTSDSNLLHAGATLARSPTVAVA